MRQLGTRGMAMATATAALLLVFVVAPTASHAAFPKAQTGKIGFEVFSAGQDDLFTANANGTGLTNITNTPAPSDEEDIAFSPTGRQIVFSRSIAPPQFDLWLANADGSAPRNITNTPDLVEFAAAWFPDGRTIVFNVCDTGGNLCNLFTSAPDGTGRRQITFSGVDTRNFNPTVSPDGRQIAFRRDVGTDRDLFVMNADGSGQVNLSNTPLPSPLNESRPAYSPDGRRIFFDRFEDGGAEGDIFSMAPNGTGVTNLTNTSTVLDTEAAPSPDGRRVAFASCPMSCDIVTIAPTGSPPAPVTLTPDPVDERNPDWQPLPRCGGKAATIVGDDGPDKIKGTKRRDVISSLGGKDTVRSRGGNDLVCLGKGKDNAVGGGGNDRCLGGKGADKGKGCEEGKL